MKIIYWKMANGHRHSFGTEKEDWRTDSNVPGGYYLGNGREVRNQGDYFDYVKEGECTYLEGCIEEIELKTKEDLEEAEKEGWILGYDFDVENVEIEFI